jgi:hypothetical protein
MSLIVDDPHTREVHELAGPPTETYRPDEASEPRPFDCADEDSRALLLAGAASAVVWVLVGVSVWRRMARRRTTDS